MKINKIDFLAALEKVMPGVSKKNISKELSFIVSDKGRIYSYNDKTSVSVKFDLGVDFVVYGSSLYEALKKVRAATLTLKKDKSILTIEAGKVFIEIPVLQDNTVLKAHEKLSYSNLDFFELPDNFLEGIKLCSTCASKNLNNLYGLYCVKITKNQIFATDRIKMMRYFIDSDIEEEIFLPEEQVKTVIAFDPVMIADQFVKNNWVFFKNKQEDVLGVKLFDVREKFPKEKFLKQFFDFKETDDFFVLPKELANDLPVLSVFSDEANVSVNVFISEDGELSIVSESVKGFSELSDVIENYKGKKLEFDINPVLLQDMLSHSAKIYVAETFLYVKENAFEYLLCFMG
jgi:hypothetical protein